MAYSDWKTRVTTGQPGDTWLNDSTGASAGGPRQHSSLTNALTGSGDFCREFRGEDSDDEVRTIFAISSSVSGGLFTEVPDTKAVSVRASIRTSNVGTPEGMIGISAKMDIDGSDGGTNQWYYPARGYNLVIGSHQNYLGSGPTNAANLSLYIYDSTSNRSVVQNVKTVSNDTWYHVRMDVTPVGTLQDRIEIYTRPSEDSTNWTLEHTEIVLNSDSYYIPWGESGAGEIGFFVFDQSNPLNYWYIDNFEAYVVDV